MRLLTSRVGFLVTGLLMSAVAAAAAEPLDGVKPGDEWTENGLQMPFCWCPAGSFRMGTPKEDLVRRNDEGPVDVTHTNGFWLGKYEVTQEQWKRLIGTEPWRVETQIQKSEGLPATWLSWEDADSFGYEFTEQERQAGRLPPDWEYQLPTEAQWEYACRAGTQTRYFFGEDESKFAEYGWLISNDPNNVQPYPHPTGLKKPNPWGFYDIYGNALEWCHDWYSPRLPGGDDPEVKSPSKERIFRNFSVDPNLNRSGYRHRYPPSERSYVMGFRLALVKRSQPAVKSQVPTTTVAVVEFENTGRSVESKRLGSAVASMLVDDLAKFARLRLLERQAAGVLIQERELAKAGVTDQAGPAQSNKDTAEYVVSGTIDVEGTNLILTAKLTKSGISKPRGEWKVEGTLNDLFSLEQQLACNLIEALGVAGTELRQPPAPREGTTPTIAILPFANQGTKAKLDVMQDGFAEILQANLSAINGVRLVERASLDKILAEQQLSISGVIAPHQAIAVGRMLQAERILTGTYLEIGDRLCVQVRLIHTGSGALVALEKVSERTEQFAEILEQLTLKIAADLSVPITESAAELVQFAMPARHLESAVHVFAGRRLRRQGKLPEAAAAYQQAILIDPSQISLYLERLLILNELGERKEAILSGERAFAQSNFGNAPLNIRSSLAGHLGALYADAGRFDDVVKLVNSTDLIDFPTRYILVQSLARQHRYNEAAEMLEKSAEEIKEKNVPDFRNQSLRELFNFYLTHSSRFGHQGGALKRDTEASREVCRKVLSIYDRVVESAVGVHDGDSGAWPGLLFPRAVNVQYWDKSGNEQDFLSPAEKVEYLERGLKTFSWHAAQLGTATYQLAENLEKSEQWDEAVKAYQERTKLPYAYQVSSYPPLEDLGHSVSEGWISDEVECYYRSATILDEKLHRESDAIIAYQRMVNEFGLVNYRGPDVLTALHKRKVEPAYADKSALVIGGGGYSLRTWQKVLSANQFKVHSLVDWNFTGAQLAPYKLVILARPGNRPFSPSELLALRSYAACGGSLLIVVTPGWEPASPIVHNPLLTFFDMEAQRDSMMWVDSTRINSHPITSGIQQVKAKWSVGLKAPAESVLVEAGNRAVLAATSYRLGRVVVSTFGQWLAPDTSIMSEVRWNFLNSSHRTAGTSLHELPFEFDHRELPLLKNVIDWLIEKRSDETQRGSWSQNVKQAHLTAQKVQAKALPWSELKPAMDDFVSKSDRGLMLEEALWLAGESFQQGVYEKPLGHGRSLYYLVPKVSIRAHLDYYDKLTGQFPDSTLLGYAAVRKCDGQRRNAGFSSTRSSKSVLAAYEKLNLKTGTYPWAWQQHRIGELQANFGMYSQAAEHFRQIAETMPFSTEKIYAVLSYGDCLAALGNSADSIRCFEQANSLPLVCWYRRGENDWHPTRREFDLIQLSILPADSREFANTSLGRLKARK